MVHQESVKQILITEEELKNVMREEICRYTAAVAGDDFEGFIKGLRLTLELSKVADRITNRLFHKEV